MRREMERMVARATLWRLAALGTVGLMLAACADPQFGDPGAIPLASGQSCGSIQQELNRLLGKGVQGNVERAAAGKAVSPAAKADVDRYNSLLNEYLGARCHV